MPNYKDYGYIVGYPQPNVIDDGIRHTQVYKVTHDGAGNRLPYMYRSFISFTYGGKNIEDFGLIAVTEGDGLVRNLSADFSDIVTSPETVDGRFYWGTHYNHNSLKLTLFTDCITQKQLDDFKLWFQPGIERELILAENPFRAIMARVGAVSTMSMIPVEYPVKVKIAGNEYDTSITKYQGSITVNFVMDDPFWYSIHNVLDYQIGDTIAVGIWKGIDGEDDTEYIVDSPDALKVLYEDRIPTVSMFEYTKNGMRTGNYVARGDNNVSASNTAPQGSLVNSAQVSGYYNGVIYESWVDLRDTITGEGTFPTFASGIGNKKYFYYAGTAPAYPTINFTITVDSSCFSGSYFSAIGNSYALINGNPYSTITAEAVNKHELKVTTPSYFTAYNHAVNLLSSGNVNEDIIREEIHDKSIRDYLINHNQSIGSLKANLYGDYRFSINCKTGVVTMTHGGVTKDAGDMIVLNNLAIIERNKFDDDGYVNFWDNNKEYVHILYHDFNTTLKNVEFLYRYMYL